MNTYHHYSSSKGAISWLIGCTRKYWRQESLGAMTCCLPGHVGPPSRGSWTKVASSSQSGANLACGSLRDSLRKHWRKQDSNRACIFPSWSRFRNSDLVSLSSAPNKAWRVPNWLTRSKEHCALTSFHSLSSVHRLFFHTADWRAENWRSGSSSCYNWNKELYLFERR